MYTQRRSLSLDRLRITLLVTLLLPHYNDVEGVKEYINKSPDSSKVCPTFLIVSG